MSSVNTLRKPLSKAALPASSAEVLGGMSLFALVHQSTMRAIESGFIEPKAQAQNSPAAFGFHPLALATKAQPPPIVMYLPPGGVGSLKMPYLKSGAPSCNCEIAQIPTFCIAQYPDARLGTTSQPPPPSGLRGDTPMLTASCQNLSA